MANTTPNKETVRRICLLSGASYCYLLVETGDDYVDVFTDIEQLEMDNCINELESWCGMKFRVYAASEDNGNNFGDNNGDNNGEKNKIAEIRTLGEKILPIRPEEMDKLSW